MRFLVMAITLLVGLSSFASAQTVTGPSSMPVYEMNAGNYIKKGARFNKKVKATADVTPVHSGGSTPLVSIARGYIGTNPTGRSRLWCGAFIDLVLRKAGYKGGGNLASAYARYGRKVSAQVGAIAVMYRKGGGHVGIVSGFDSKGKVIVISGNHNKTTAESVYPKSRIYAYVLPGS